MRNYYAFLLVLLFHFVSQAQIVAIPDPAFKAELISQDIDTNNDGEIQVSEAEAVTHLSLNMCDLDSVVGIKSFTNLTNLSFSSYCQIATMVDLSGMTSISYLAFHKSSMPGIDIDGLTNLETISVGYASPNFINLGSAINLRSISLYNSGITSLDLSQNINMVSLSAQNTGIALLNVTGLTHMESLFCDGGSGLTSLDVTDLVNLKLLKVYGSLNAIDVSQNVLLEELNVDGNNLTSLDVSNLPNLKELFFSGNQISSIDISNNPNLERLSCAGNFLTSLDFSNTPNLNYLYCPQNQLTSIDLTNLHKLYRINVSENLFTSLDFSGQTDLIPGDMPIYDINDNPNLISVSLKNGKQDFTWLGNINCPNLVYLCADDVDMENIQWAFMNNGVTNIQANTYCDFVPGGDYNTITGKINFHDEGCGNGTGLPMQGIKVNLDGVNASSTFTNSNGEYTFYTQAGDFTITPQMTNALLSVSPENAAVSFTNNTNNMETRDFCLSAVGDVSNLNISIIPVGTARPGFDATYDIIYQNIGNQVLSGAISFTYDDALTDFVAATPMASQSTGNLTWNYADLLPSEIRKMTVKLNVNSPMEIPAVNNGDVLHYHVNITPIVGNGSANQVNLDQTVVGSFDPNDKTCLEGTTMTPDKVGGYLNYLIRFQNSGTAPAENVVVKDMIDIEKFDMSSLQLVGSSHPYVSRITGNKVEFIFEGINLPTETDDEPGSHGYVTFKIKTKSTLVLGNEVTNIADIYFDYNFPITTEPATTTVSLLANKNFDKASVSVYPNPVKNKLQIQAKEKITSVQLFDLQGRLIRTANGNGIQMDFDMSENEVGVYFVKVTTAKGVKTEKIIKE